MEAGRKDSSARSLLNGLNRCRQPYRQRAISYQVGLHFLVPLITRVHCPVARLIEARLTVLEARSSCHPETYR
jgi:hypothetical protein